MLDSTRYKKLKEYVADLYRTYDVKQHIYNGLAQDMYNRGAYDTLRVINDLISELEKE